MYTHLTSCITLENQEFTELFEITRHQGNSICLSVFIQHYMIHLNLLFIYRKSPHTTLHYTTLHYTTLHYTTLKLHYTTLHYT